MKEHATRALGREKGFQHVFLDDGLTLMPLLQGLHALSARKAAHDAARRLNLV